MLISMSILCRLVVLGHIPFGIPLNIMVKSKIILNVHCKLLSAVARIEELFAI